MALLSRARRVRNSILRALIPDTPRPPPPPNEAINLGSGEVNLVVHDYVYGYEIHTPFFIPLVSLVQLITFVVYAIKLRDVTANRGGIDYNSSLIYHPLRRQEVWRFVTYSMLHKGYVHLVSNLLLQLIFGIFLEFGYGGIIAIPYLLGIAAGSMLHSMWDSNTFLVGVSGGVYALLGGHLATVFMSWGRMNEQLSCSNFKIIFLILSAPVRTFVIIFLLSMDFGMAIKARLEGSQGPKVSHAAHIAGFLAGFLLGPLCFRLSCHPWKKLKTWRRVLCIIFLLLFLLLVLIAIFFNVLCASHGLCETNKEVERRYIWIPEAPDNQGVSPK